MHNTYLFSLVLAGVTDKTEDLEDGIYEAGCDDALISFRNGTVYLDFERSAVHFEDAVISAIFDIEKAHLPITVVSVSPDDYVTESEIAKRLSVKRQAISLWVKGARCAKTPFPTPVMKLTEKSPLWRWHEVAKWLYQQKKIHDKEVIEIARCIETLNLALAERDPEVRKYRKHLSKRLNHGKI